PQRCLFCLCRVFWSRVFGELALLSHLVQDSRREHPRGGGRSQSRRARAGALSNVGKPTMEGDSAGVGEGDGVDEVKACGWRLRELRCWRGLTLREAAGLAGLSFSFWGQVERGEKAVNSRRTLEAMATALRVHPADLTGQPWAVRDTEGIDTEAALV